ncbi:MAG TPA: hypothetical protein VFT74_00715 [Isosphaeraceae bacterium]|nr:hypothetical protein [Isosphaeraceae bacterium]
MAHRLPRSGKVVPQFEESLRESLVYGSYRVIYEIMGPNVALQATEGRAWFGSFFSSGAPPLGG